MLPHHALLHTPKWKERHLAFRRDDAENAQALTNLLSSPVLAHAPNANLCASEVVLTLSPTF